MPGTENQRKAFEFFSRVFASQETFSKDDVMEATGWTRSSLDTYWLKQFRGFVVAVSGSEYRVGEAFRRVARWEDFRRHVTQVRAVASSDYTFSSYENVLIYEFFMPLTHETELRVALDALFYRDSVLRRLRSCSIEEIGLQVDRHDGEEEGAYMERVSDWVADKFVGYSISHVSGRFRAERLATYAEAAEIQSVGRYLIDETTAVTRFIFPCSGEKEAAAIRWFFDALFIGSIIEVVHGEDEIWMVESGMNDGLHIWRVADS